MALLEIQDLQKSFLAPDGTRTHVLDVPRFQLDAGQELGLAGQSGSGKTTLLHVIAGILSPDSGVVQLAGRDLARMSEGARDAWRSVHLGYVYQSFNLLQGYTAVENVLLGMMFGPGPDVEFARKLLQKLGLADRMDHRPAQLSIGQQQRVALARALANRPKLVLADEPTGNLDPQSAKEALGLLREMCREENAALLLVSHDRDVLASMERTQDLREINRVATGAGEEPAVADTHPEERT